MTRLAIRHETTYRYGQAVAFGLHRLMVRPRDSHADRLVEASLELSPPGETRWAYDALGNCVCWYQPHGEAAELRIVSNLVIERFPAPLAPFKADNPHSAMPIVYGLADRRVLEPFIAPATDVDLRVRDWIKRQMGAPDEPALQFLTRLAGAIRAEFRYGGRDAPGVQSPGETIEAGAGTCRDFAWLMIEALRRLGYASRFVTGYLYSPPVDPSPVDPSKAADPPGAEPVGKRQGAGATHAWCDVFLPGLGWMEFDPTNGLAESPDLIRVAAVRTPEEAAPIVGAIIGDPRSCEMSVKIEVHIMDPPPTRSAAT
jgi:transglutaminase-like putative cysteine protease